jgi:hypothetical protein
MDSFYVWGIVASLMRRVIRAARGAGVERYDALVAPDAEAWLELEEGSAWNSYRSITGASVKSYPNLSGT